MTAAWKSWDTAPDGADLAAWQDGRCAWCGHRDSLVTDHCHMTGLVRGLLCRRCNQAEGNDWRGHFDGWRSGDNPAAALGEFSIYRSIYGITPTSPQSALNYYTYSARIGWFDRVVAELNAGGEWPIEAPWTPEATALRDEGMAHARAAMDKWSA